MRQCSSRLSVPKWFHRTERRPPARRERIRGQRSAPQRTDNLGMHLACATSTACRRDTARGAMFSRHAPVSKPPGPLHWVVKSRRPRVTLPHATVCSPAGGGCAGRGPGAVRRRIATGNAARRLPGSHRRTGLAAGHRRGLLGGPGQRRLGGSLRFGRRLEKPSRLELHPPGRGRTGRGRRLRQ